MKTSATWLNYGRFRILLILVKTQIDKHILWLTTEMATIKVA